MNPGKVVDPYRAGPESARRSRLSARGALRRTFNFRTITAASPPRRSAVSASANAARLDGGTMCPSFKATREEMHTTRGRAHLLFEMMRGDVIADGWRDEHVKESLDLCLACKGCKSDCPVSVDMATYKAEFLAHYYEGRIRPRQAYAMGLVANWARIASRAPALANFLSHAPVLGQIAKFAAGISQKREIPSFAPQTFRSWFARRDNEEFRRYAGSALAGHLQQLLSAAYRAGGRGGAGGCRMRGRDSRPRPLLRPSALRLRHAADRRSDGSRRSCEALGPEIDAGTPVVFLEPSCAAVFRDEMLSLFPDHQRGPASFAAGVSVSTSICERIEYRPPRLERKRDRARPLSSESADGHEADPRRSCGAMGVKPSLLDSGCCGMAGSFGFERGHYDVSMKVGEHVLLPRVRSAPAGNSGRSPTGSVAASRSLKRRDRPARCILRRLWPWRCRTERRARPSTRKPASRPWKTGWRLPRRLAVRACTALLMRRLTK